MDTQSVAPTTTARKPIKRVGNEVFFPVVTHEERKRRQALAVAFLARYGRD